MREVFIDSGYRNMPQRWAMHWAGRWTLDNGQWKMGAGCWVVGVERWVWQEYGLMRKQLDNYIMSLTGNNLRAKCSDEHWPKRAHTHAQDSVIWSNR